MSDANVIPVGWLDLSRPSHTVVFATGGARYITIQLSANSGFGTGVVTVLRGNSIGGPFVALATPQSFSAAGVGAEITVDAAYIALQVTTTAGSQVIVEAVARALSL